MSQYPYKVEALIHWCASYTVPAPASVKKSIKVNFEKNTEVKNYHKLDVDKQQYEIKYLE